MEGEGDFYRGVYISFWLVGWRVSGTGAVQASANGFLEMRLRLDRWYPNPARPPLPGGVAIGEGSIDEPGEELEKRIKPWKRQKNRKMEERTWDLVEKFISGEASEQEFRELRELLSKNHDVYILVKEFLDTYEDPDPQITPGDKQEPLSGVADQVKNKEHVHQ